ncbi:MAG TPA: UDP-3-O-(3-hydroxymyristoyl)glucosamine N-acyltransferase [Blastocatellia bacterium]|nr:UDP-3-O-(3-hydroxymyristoyl)glucosamine N-acyltransferase [Blastocatellia bacterium]
MKPGGSPAHFSQHLKAVAREPRNMGNFTSAESRRRHMPRLSELAKLIDAELIGQADAEINRARPFDQAAEGDVTLALDAAYVARVDQSHATAVIVSAPIAGSARNQLVARNPKLAFARAIQVLHAIEHKDIGVSRDLLKGEGTILGNNLSVYPRVTIGRNTTIGDRVSLHSGVVIGDRCSIGHDTVIFANVSIYDDCKIGSNVVVHAGAVIGGDGFGFVRDDEGRQLKLLHLGGVLIEDDCEIGANCAIDRGGFGDTILRRGVKLDNLVQVGHNCDIGEDTVVAALTGFSGGTRVGRRCVIAGQVGTNQHITIGDDVIVTGQAGVTKGVRDGAFVSGTPARDHNAWRRSQVLYSKLPDMAERIRQLERTVAALTQSHETETDQN